MNVNVTESTKLEEQDSTIPRGASPYRHRYACQINKLNSYACTKL